MRAYTPTLAATALLLLGPVRVATAQTGAAKTEAIVGLHPSCHRLICPFHDEPARALARR